MAESQSTQPNAAQNMADSVSVDDPPMAVEASATPAGPVSESERLVVLDVLRGIALLGILMVNMQTFALPFMQGLEFASLGDATLSEQLVGLGIKWLFEYKFVTLFSLLFGIGFVVQITRAESRGEPFVGKYLRRLLVLGLIGLAHGIGLWYGDILFIYACFGLLLLPLSGLSPRTLMILAVISMCISAIAMTGLGLLEYVATALGSEQIQAQYAEAEAMIQRGEAPSGWEAIVAANFNPGHPLWLDGEMRAYRDGPLANALVFRVTTFAFAIIASILTFGWHVLAMFLLGTALMKVGFFSKEKRHWHRRLVTIALPLGLLLEGGHAIVLYVTQFEPSLVVSLMSPLREVGSLSLMLGYVGLVCGWVSSERATMLMRPLADTGRMALTVYLSTTLVATSIMYWWGLGYFGTFSRVELIGLSLLIYLGLMAGSVLWLKYFRFGPLEWLWRSFVYRRMPAIR